MAGFPPWRSAIPSQSLGAPRVHPSCPQHAALNTQAAGARLPLSDREQLVLGDAGGWWSGGDGVWNIFCGKTLIQLKERDGLRWESGRGRAKIWL